MLNWPITYNMFIAHLQIWVNFFYIFSKMLRIPKSRNYGNVISRICYFRTSYGTLYGIQHNGFIAGHVLVGEKRISTIVLNSTTLIIPINVCSINSQNTHYFAKSQNSWGLNILLSNTKFMNAHLFTIPFQKFDVCSNVLVEWSLKLYANTCLSMNSLRMNNASTFWWIQLLWIVFLVTGAAMNNAS